MAELTAQKADLEVKIAREEIQDQVLTRPQVEFWFSKMISLDLANHDNKQRNIDTFINSIYVYADKAVINFNWRGIRGDSSPIKYKRLGFKGFGGSKTG